MVQVNKTVTRNIGGRQITLRNVPTLYCDECKETLLNAKTVKKMDELIQNSPDETHLDYPTLFQPEVFSYFPDLDKFFLEETEEPVKLAEIVTIMSSTKLIA